MDLPAKMSFFPRALYRSGIYAGTFGSYEDIFGYLEYPLRVTPYYVVIGDGGPELKFSTLEEAFNKFCRSRGMTLVEARKTVVLIGEDRIVGVMTAPSSNEGLLRLTKAFPEEMASLVASTLFGAPNYACVEMNQSTGGVVVLTPSSEVTGAEDLRRSKVSVYPKMDDFLSRVDRLGPVVVKSEGVYLVGEKTYETPEEVFLTCFEPLGYRCALATDDLPGEASSSSGVEGGETLKGVLTNINNLENLLKYLTNHEVRNTPSSPKSSDQARQIGLDWLDQIRAYVSRR